MKLGVIGLGHVGLVTAACFAEMGHQVLATDKDIEKMRQLRGGGLPIYERTLPELLRRHLGGSLNLRDSIATLVNDVEAVFLCVGTPGTPDGGTDLSCVDDAVRDIARRLHGRLLVVEKSTVPIRTCETIQRTMILNGATRGSFRVASNPEFLREGTAVADFLCPDRIVIGTDDDWSRRLLARIYLPLTSGAYYKRTGRMPGANLNLPRLIQATTKSAELIEHACNAFLAMKISFINAVANIAELSGADIDEVRESMGADQRIGSQFLQAGIGYGGSCFPKDVLAFKALAEREGYRFDLLNQVIRINLDQPIRFLDKIHAALASLRGKRIAVLGLSFKGGTDDIRESPALKLVELLVDEGARIVAFDPAAMDRARVALPGKSLEFANDPYGAMRDADALLILTDWPQFAHLDLKHVRELLRAPVILDGRNLYSLAKMAEAGFNYISVGRSPVGPFFDAAEAEISGNAVTEGDQVVMVRQSFQDGAMNGSEPDH
jgi:UDPglucose 6-dehydrogenase